MAALNSLVSEAIDIVVHCARVNGSPRVTEIVAVEDQQTGRDATAFTVTDLFHRGTAGGSLEWSGQLPVRALRAFEDAGIDLRGIVERAARSGGVAP